MTIEQRTEILKDLPVGSAVQANFFHSNGKPSPVMIRTAIKINDGKNCMHILSVATDRNYWIPYENLTCDMIEKSEAVRQRLMQ